jgi:hypothetical protein
MFARIASVALAGLALAGARGPEGADVNKQRAVRSTELPRPRDPDIAVRAELEAARRTATLAAYDRFLARHADHKLAQTARRERAAIAARRRR